MLKTLFYEVVGARITIRFALWLKSKGYKEEGNVILEALKNWAVKETNRSKYR